MRKTYLLALAIILLYSSCNKDFQSNTPESFNYSINKSDLTIDANSYLHYNPLNISNGDVSKSPITISYKGMPANVTVTPSSITVDTNYSPLIVFAANNSAPGIYPMQMTVSGNTIGTQTYNFNLTVAPSSNCASNINPSTVYIVDGCSGLSYDVTLDTIPGSPNMFTISNFENLGVNYKVLVFIDCGAIIGATNDGFTELYIPKQTVNGYTISGRGEYEGTLGNQFIDINDTVTNPNNVTTICTDLELEP